MKQARGDRGLRPSVVWLALGLLLTAQVAGLVRASSGTFSNPDAPGYLLQARGLATAGTTVLRPGSPAQFVDLQFLHVGGGEFRSRYPPGLPVLQALPYRLGGVPAALAVNPVLAVLGGLLLFLLARRWVGPWLALFGVLLYATLPVLNEQALTGMAHVAVATALVAALLALELWSERPTKGRAILLGLLLGALPALRYPAALPTLVIGAFAALRCVRSPAHRRTARIGAVAFAVPLAALVAHNVTAFGSPLATGYGLTGEDAAFSLHYLQLNVLGYLESIRVAAGAVALFGLGGVIAMVRNPEWRTRGVLLFVLVTAWTLLYAAYYWSLTGPRFLLPVFTLLVVAAVSLLHLLRPGFLRAALTVVLAGWHLAGAVDDGLPRLERLADELETAAQVLGELRTAVPPRSVLIAPLAIRILAGPYGEWKLAEPSLLWPDRTELVMPPLPDPPPGGTPVSPMQPDRTIELRSPLTGFDGAARTAAVLEELVRWAGPGTGVYFLGDPDALEEIEPHHALIGDFVRVGRVDLPEMDAKSPRSGPRSPPDFRFWIPRPPLVLFRFVPRVEGRLGGRKIERPHEIARLGGVRATGTPGSVECMCSCGHTMRSLGLFLLGRPPRRGCPAPELLAPAHRRSPGRPGGTPCAPNGFSVRVRMPTPAPGTYEAPAGHEDGPPEAFTLWIFANGIPFHGAGHVVGGPHLTLSGHISKETVPFTGGEPLGSDETDAEVRITIAPHGKVDPDKLPDQIKTPAAGPDYWWFAEFD